MELGIAQRGHLELDQCVLLCKGPLDRVELLLTR